MGATRRTQILMEPDEYRRLRAEARRRKVSVAKLIRDAIRQVYFTPEVDRRAIVAEMLKMQLGRLPSWKRLKKEIEARHDVLG